MKTSACKSYDLLLVMMFVPCFFLPHLVLCLQWPWQEILAEERSGSLEQEQEAMVIPGFKGCFVFEDGPSHDHESAIGKEFSSNQQPHQTHRPPDWSRVQLSPIQSHCLRNQISFE